MKVTWPVKGNKITFEITTAKVEQKPTEGEWFEVKPWNIDQKLFRKKRINKK